MKRVATANANVITEIETMDNLSFIHSFNLNNNRFYRGFPIIVNVIVKKKVVLKGCLVIKINLVK